MIIGFFFVVGDFYCFWFPAKMRLQKMTMAIFSQGNFVISEFDFAFILKYQCIFFQSIGKIFLKDDTTQEASVPKVADL